MYPHTIIIGMQVIDTTHTGKVDNKNTAVCNSSGLFAAYTVSRHTTYHKCKHLNYPLFFIAQEHFAQNHDNHHHLHLV